MRGLDGWLRDFRNAIGVCLEQLHRSLRQYSDVQAKERNYHERLPLQRTQIQSSGHLGLMMSVMVSMVLPVPVTAKEDSLDDAECVPSS